MPCDFFRVMWADAFDRLKEALVELVKIRVDSKSKRRPLAALMKVIGDTLDSMQAALRRPANNARLMQLDKEGARMVYSRLENLAAKYRDLNDMVKWLDEASWQAEFAGQLAVFAGSITGDDSLETDLTAVCSKIKPAKTFRLYVSEQWPTVRNDDLGFRQHCADGDVSAGADRVVELVKNYLKEHPDIKDRLFSMPRLGALRSYPGANLNGLNVRKEARIIFACEEENNITKIYFCFFVTEGMHNDDSATDACVNAYSRLYKPSCRDKLSYVSFTGWREIESTNELCVK